ncbi:putative tRNA-methyl transferase [Trypanosoma cruzi]|uniref:Putative tRNA-methyl transferase n=1 Tax=Trypanosoma cruzi TaxID=5693 RepID=A0A2V2UY01_TRYCR|nr:putative tRNA-methyl transferase [Trypanosoma cruzi]
MSCTVVRVAIALSGGVDSAVAALFLRRCVPHWGDVEALWRLERPLALCEVVEALEQQRPLSEVVALAPATGNSHDPAAAVKYFPLFMKNWDDAFESDGVGQSWCEAAQQEYNDATDVARALGLLHSREILPSITTAPVMWRNVFNLCWMRMLVEQRLMWTYYAMRK